MRYRSKSSCEPYLYITTSLQPCRRPQMRPVQPLARRRIQNSGPLWHKAKPEGELFVRQGWQWGRGRRLLDDHRPVEHAPQRQLQELEEQIRADEGEDE